MDEKVTNNEQKVTSNEQRSKSPASCEFSFRRKLKRTFIINTIKTHLVMIVVIKLLM